MLEKVKQFVNESFEKSVNFSPIQLIHFDRTIYWINILKPDADEAMLIAAYAHDIARAFRLSNPADTFKNRGFNDEEYLREHQENGAKIMAEFLKKESYDNQDIERIFNMIAHHEVGGDEEANLLKDADSLSYMENNIDHFIEMIPTLGKDKIKSKIDWMYNRISSDKAKELARPYYGQAMKTLATIT